MEKDHKHDSGGFSNGFLMGAIIGAGLVFFLGTKKGKQILKTLTENGFEGVSELADLFSDEDDMGEYTAEGDVLEHQQKTEHKPTKRFFKRIKK